MHAHTVRMYVIQASTAGHSVGRDIPGMTHGAHLRLDGDETSLFINVGRRGTRRCVSSLLRERFEGTRGNAADGSRAVARCRIDRDFWIECFYSRFQR